MAKRDLPPEIWTKIFDIAADEDIIFAHNSPTIMADCAWFRNAFGEWILRTPEDSIALIQRRSYATKKAIISTCKLWRRLGAEFLFRCLFFDNPNRMELLCKSLEAEPKLGWWSRRIHLTRYHTGRSPTMDEMESHLKIIIRHCPNLEIFAIDWPVGTGFGPIADALCTYCKRSLHSVRWRVPYEALSKVIWTLDSLPDLRSLHLEFDKPRSNKEDTVHLGSASNLALELPHLEQLSLVGFFQDFLEQASDWSFPSLQGVSLNSGINCYELPDVVDFLFVHGSTLTFLDLDCVAPLDVSTILDICPLLTSFSFNADWSLPTPDEDPTAMVASLVNGPHLHIKEIGLHGLSYAFGVGWSLNSDSLRSALTTRANLRNFASLTRENFPALQCIRVLGRGLLRDLNDSDGPDEQAYERWERWWEQCAAHNVRLEDCTGAFLGTLPQISGVRSEDGDDETDDDDEDVSDGENEVAPPESAPQIGALDELRELLEECRRMTAEREEPVFAEMSWHGIL